MNVFGFLRWKLRQATISDWLWGFGCALMLIGAFRVETDGKYFIAIGFIFWILIIFFELIIKGIKRDYEEFKQEQNQLFETIKNSDQK